MTDNQPQLTRDGDAPWISVVIRCIATGNETVPMGPPMQVISEEWNGEGPRPNG
jgi:hypothetical protein